MAARIGAV